MEWHECATPGCGTLISGSKTHCHECKPKRCTCPPGFYDAACPVHHYEADRQQLERDLRHIPKRNRQPLIDDENRIESNRL